MQCERYTGADLSCAIDTSTWRSSVTICSALNLFFGMTKAPFQDSFSQTAWYKRPGQVNLIEALFAAVRWSLLALSGNSLRRNSLSAFGPKRTTVGFGR